MEGKRTRQKVLEALGTKGNIGQVREESGSVRKEIGRDGSP